ncbi:DUF6209 family protein [Myxococcaceae bacterium GXIMD 01537]
MLRRLSWLLLPVLLVGGAAAAQTPALHFNADWSITASSDPLPVGAQVAVVYDANRLPQCRGTTSTGGPAWSITGFYSVNGGAAQSFWVAGHSPDPNPPAPALVLPAGESGDVAVWFQVTSLYGCSAYDSNYGDNFHFNVGAPSLQFNADFSEVARGTLKAGQTFILNYDLSRLPNCRQTYNGMPTWEITVTYRFDGGPTTTTPVTTTNGGYTRVSNPTPIAVPAGAHTVEMWFLNADRASCQEYDSDYGQNYRFTLH